MKFRFLATLFLSLTLSVVLVAQPRAQMKESKRDMTVSARYMLVPAADNGSMARLTLTMDGESLLGEPQTIRLAAAESATYWIPIDMADKMGKQVTVTITGGEADGVHFADSIPMEYDEQYRLPLTIALVLLLIELLLLSRRNPLLAHLNIFRE